ncbi:SAM50-like protein SPAC17C9.06 [Lasiodiplodia hormozganensis]|uniref:SAM50-like protein n=2 Tax=Lasiodiplodia TaxID=66739 RepID=A0A5N5DH02_9PEZI|nr:Outer membrane protein [Lasiodiplodia theobromae]KAB2577075.1 SAM50-like protein [Lasiodiplodia theobromae]KAF4543772.1 Outer membrane protein [Lasiodiplodia theobromae]KAK0662346.1 SAM50-like protein SPAC17C9.06 [Lasiodiplodia hormozganensis]
MASPQDDHVFEKLKQKVDPAELQQRQREINERIAAQYERAVARQADLVGSNFTLPVTVSSVRVLHAKHTRHAFLERVFSPLLNANKEPSYTLEDALADIGGAVNKLERFDIFKSPISVYVDRPDKSNPSTTPTDIDVYLHARERSRYTIKTGTEAGSAEGSAYASAQLRNLFGGAESLNAHASAGTRTRSAYSAYFDTPILSNPDLRWEIGGLASSTLKSWASHEEVLKGGSTKLKWQSSGGHRHELAYSGFWRQITGLAATASPTVRADAGDSFKSSISHTYTLDRRDFPLLPSRGYLLKTVAELAGGPLKGDVGFGKLELESQAALPFPPIPGVALTTSFRAGLLHPFVDGTGKPTPSRINDRFQLGGPTDVRGFRLAGLGPRDGPDAVGGDVFAAGSASLMLPLPRVGAETPLRLQAFVNAGRLLALKERRDSEGNADAKESLKATLEELKNGLPSAAAGIGLVYAHPVARFEVNFSLPLVLRKGEQGRKGVHFGVGIEFM